MAKYKPFFGIAGLKRAGKDTVAKFIRDLAFPKIYIDDPAWPIRNFCETNFGYTEMNKDTQIEWLQHIMPGVTQRHIQQVMGTEFGRQILHEDIWVELLKRRLAISGAEQFCNPSVRFVNEAKMIKDMGGMVIWVGNPRVVQPYDPNVHASELGIPTGLVDAVVWNDGDLEMLEARVRGMLKHYGFYPAERS